MKLRIKLLRILNNNIKKAIRDAFKIDPEVISYAKMRTFLELNTKEQNINYISLADSFYHIESINTWKKIIKLDWTDEMKYIKEVRDCDNFAFNFVSRMGEYYGLNSSGVVHGHVPGGHFWVAIVARDEYNVLSLYQYEPMNDNLVKSARSLTFHMGNWDYKPDSYRFF